MLAPQWIKFNPGHVYSSVLKMQQDQILKNSSAKAQIEKSNAELGILNEEHSNDGLGESPIQSTADQANLFRIEQLLTRNSNMIKEP